MSAPLSVIIPVLNGGERFEACLSALLGGVETGLLREVIVVDGGSTDRTLLPAFQSGARVVVGVRGRGRQLACGASKARGDWCLFLHADTVLSPDWPEAVASHIANASDKAAAFRLAYDADHSKARWLAGRANWRAKTFGLPYGDQGLLISRALYDEVGGFEDMPLMEDVSIVRRIGKSRLVLLPAKAETSAAKYERDGYRRRAWHNAFLLVRYLMGASPETLAKAYS